MDRTYVTLAKTHDLLVQDNKFVWIAYHSLERPIRVFDVVTAHIETAEPR
jgi:hypothetical protein